MDTELRGKIKDIIIIISFVASALVWYVTKTTSEAVNAEYIKNHTQDLKNINRKLDLQYELNGKIIMYMEMDSKHHE